MSAIIKKDIIIKVLMLQQFLRNQKNQKSMII